MHSIRIAVANLAQECYVAVAGNAKREAVANHPHHQTENRHRVRAAIDKITQKNRFPVFGWLYLPIGTDLISKALQQFREFLEAAVHIADDVEGAMFKAAIACKWFALYGGRMDFLRTVQEVDVVKAFARKQPKRPTQILRLAAQNMRRKVAIG